MQPEFQLTLHFIMPAGVPSFTATYPNGVGIPIPQLGDLAAGPGDQNSYPIKYRTWQYTGNNLLINFACFN